MFTITEKIPRSSAPDYGYITPPFPDGVSGLKAPMPTFTTPAPVGSGRSPLPASIFYKSNPSTTQKDPILAVVYSRALKSDAQNLYAPGDFLFGFKTPADYNNKKYSSEPKVVAASIWVLNAYLEEGCAVKNQEDIMRSGKRSKGETKQVRLAPDVEKSEFYCFSVKEFCEKWLSLGVIATILNRGPDREKLFTVIQKNAAGVPNLWGNVSVGDRVGFCVKEIDNPYRFRYGPIGNNVGPRTPTKILQLVPCLEKHRAVPILLTKADRPEKADLCFFANHVFEGQKVYKTQTAYDDKGGYPGKLIYEEEKDVEQPTTLPLLESGFFIPVGTVSEIHNASPPPRSAIEGALRDPKQYHSLLADYRLEVIV